MTLQLKSVGALDFAMDCHGFPAIQLWNQLGGGGQRSYVLTSPSDPNLEPARTWRTEIICAHLPPPLSQVHRRLLEPARLDDGDRAARLRASQYVQVSATECHGSLLMFEKHV